MHSSSSEHHPGPASGVFRGALHLFPVRVYYEDTDLSGIVYYANYLKFMERARSDLLALLGVDQRAAWEAGEGAYAVAEVAISYRSPARLDDALTVATRPLKLGAASIRLEQRIARGDVLLTEANVRVGFLSPDGRPRRQPAAWRAKFADQFTTPEVR
jgi:acyl-CoA thioester hydrolase